MEGWRVMLGIEIDDENTPTETYFCPACAAASRSAVTSANSAGAVVCGEGVLLPTMFAFVACMHLVSRGALGRSEEPSRYEPRC
jgi:hypothetical protein